MEFLIVPSRGLTRLSSRLVHLLSSYHWVRQWTTSQFETAGSNISKDSAVLFLGESRYSKFLGSLTTPGYSENGVRWSYKDRVAVIHAVDDNQSRPRTLATLEDEITQLYEKVWPKARSKIEYGDDPSAYGGTELAALYLNEELKESPKDDKSRKHVMGTKTRITDLQYRLGIGHFLAHGFDSWLDTIGGGSPIQKKSKWDMLTTPKKRRSKTTHKG